jgi:iron complex outermembrane receptor protein
LNILHGTAFQALAIALLSGMTSYSAPALAQTAGTAAEDASTQPAPENEIIVTAQRRAERLEDVPASITAISSSRLETSGVSHLSDLGRVTPGLKITNVGNNIQPAIRGVSILVTGAGQEPNVSTYIDGFYQPSVLLLGQDLANLAGVEVLKGPQGSLYGRNATGGVLLINTLEPSKDLTANVTGSYGSFNDLRLSGYVSVPIAETLSLGVAGYYRRSDNWIKDATNFGATFNTGPSADQPPTAPYGTESVRVKLKYQPTDDIKILLGYNHLHLNNPIGLTYTLVGRSALLANGTLAATGKTVTYQQDKSSLNFAPVNSELQNEFTGLVEIKTGDFGTLTSHTSYEKGHARFLFDFDGTTFNANTTDVRLNDHVFIQSVDYAMTPAKGVELLTGALYYKSYNYQLSYTSSNSQVAPYAANPTATSDVTARTESYAVYADGTWEALSHLFLTGGVRYSSDLKKIAANAPLGTPRPNPEPPRHRWSSTTFRAVARYQFADRMNVYASFSQGFKSGIFNALGVPSSVNPETINAYEVGVKGATGRLNGSISAFHYDYKNLQVQTLISPLVVSLTNAASAKVNGIEAELNGQVTDALTIHTGLSYLHARYDRFTTANGIGLNANGTNSSATNLQDWSGLQLPRAPDWSGDIGANYEFDNVFSGKVDAGGDMTFSSSFYPSNNTYINATHAPRYKSNGYVLFNGQIAWTSESGRFRLGVYGENVFNKRYKVVFAGSSASGDYAVYNQPAAFGFRFGLKY